MNITERDFRGVDLNLLVTLLVLLRERSVTRAAEKLHLGQPAVSGALSRLRELFDDPILVRTAQGMSPTVKALQLEAELLPALGKIHSALFEPSTFDPATSEGVFTVGMSDWVEVWLGPRLIAKLHQLAPSIRLAIKSVDPFQGPAMLEQNGMDLGVSCFMDGGPAWMLRKRLCSMGFLSVYDPAQVAITEPLTLEQYVSHPHLMVTYKGAFESNVDVALAEMGLRRTVQFALPRFSTLPPILKRIPALATVPSVVASCMCAASGLRATAPPLALADTSVDLVWRATRDKDPALRWLMTLIEACLQEAMAL
ncbi:LysR substrate-binding domain-containing protein [Hahella aquimaris]|uniref:LysR family transcriptional regulator n=1 Tax=Hahella sp. HNIBRBA332 TaxID=3015983 RepID=UPI00273CA957|nr:LysR family transcriptional regulator [Hahella sp. HNIBRBA332]WLQ16114.1 LysR substrate-binding domain-containing protein [Hahella sp. HNIBRBA332]